MPPGPRQARRGSTPPLRRSCPCPGHPGRHRRWPPEKSPSKEYKRGRGERGVVDRMHPVIVAVAGVQRVHDFLPGSLSGRGRVPSAALPPGGCAQEQRRAPMSAQAAADDSEEGCRMGGGHEHRRIDPVRRVADACVLPRHPGGGRRDHPAAAQPYASIRRRAPIHSRNGLRRVAVSGGRWASSRFRIATVRR